MTDSGHLDSSWGYGTVSNDPIAPSMISEPDSDQTISKLADVVRDMALLHSLCLDAFTSVVGKREEIKNTEELKACMDYLCTRCSIEQFEMSDIEDLWCGQMNFSEFMLISKELFVSIHRVFHHDLSVEG